MSVATRDYLFTIDDFLRMGELGIIAPERRVELIAGRIYEMSPLGIRHALVLAMLQRHFLPVIMNQSADLWPQNPLHLAPDNYLEPDLLLITRDCVEKRRMPTSEDIHLLIEIADTSLAVDRDSKAQLYAAAGIREYWIVNLVDNVVEVHRRPDPATSAWLDRHLYKVGDSISPLAFPDVTIPVEGLF